MFLFGESGQLLENFLQAATAFSIGMNGKRFGIGDFGVGFIQSLQRSDFAPQALYSI